MGKNISCNAEMLYKQDIMLFEVNPNSIFFSIGEALDNNNNKTTSSLHIVTVNMTSILFYHSLPMFRFMPNGVS